MGRPVPKVQESQEVVKAALSFFFGSFWLRTQSFDFVRFN